MTYTPIALLPKQLLEAWRQETGRLRLPAPVAARPQERTAVRIRLEGKPVEATIVGTVVSSHGSGARQETELAPDREGVRAMQILVAAARGEPVQFMQRGLRYLARLPVFVDWSGSTVYMTTFSVSERGCGIVWSGSSLPTLGQAIHLRFGAGPRAAEFRGVVCWVRASRPNSTVGVLLIMGRNPSAAWDQLLRDAEKSGAPT